MREALDDCLAKRNLLGVALGKGSQRASTIKDYDLSRLPPSLNMASPWCSPERMLS